MFSDNKSIFLRCMSSSRNTLVATTARMSNSSLSSATMLSCRRQPVSAARCCCCCDPSLGNDAGMRHNTITQITRSGAHACLIKHDHRQHSAVWRLHCALLMTCNSLHDARRVVSSIYTANWSVSVYSLNTFSFTCRSLAICLQRSYATI